MTLAATPPRDVSMFLCAIAQTEACERDTDVRCVYYAINNIYTWARCDVERASTRYTPRLVRFTVLPEKGYSFTRCHRNVLNRR